MTFVGRVLFLGTGSSAGVPVVGCRCDTCKSKDLHDKRLRPSILLQLQDKTFLIDPGPDFRQQALKHDINHLDGVIVTHVHYDHTGGLDELRSYYFISERPMPTLVSEHTIEDLSKRYHYLLKPTAEGGSLSARLDFESFPNGRGEVDFQGVKIKYFSYSQAGMPVNGFRFGNFAYVTDIHEYPETIFEDLKGVDTLVVSALRYTPSNLHLTVDEAIDFAKKVGAKRVFLTHIAHEISHEKCKSYLPEEVTLAYDGLSFDL